MRIHWLPNFPSIHPLMNKNRVVAQFSLCRSSRNKNQEAASFLFSPFLKMENLVAAQFSFLLFMWWCRKIGWLPYSFAPKISRNKKWTSTQYSCLLSLWWCQRMGWSLNVPSLTIVGLENQVAIGLSILLCGGIGLSRFQERELGGHLILWK